jgi:hypothetical protein
LQFCSHLSTFQLTTLLLLHHLTKRVSASTFLPPTLSLIPQEKYIIHCSCVDSDSLCVVSTCYLPVVFLPARGSFFSLSPYPQSERFRYPDFTKPPSYTTSYKSYPFSLPGLITISYRPGHHATWSTSRGRRPSRSHPGAGGSSAGLPRRGGEGGGGWLREVKRREAWEEGTLLLLSLLGSPLSRFTLS